MQNRDVLIVGGGPAGSTLAWALRQAGRDVLVLDRSPFPRDKPCAGWITPAVVSSLRLDTERYRRHHVLQPIYGFRVGVMGGKEVATPLSAEPLSYGVRRCEFDDYLLRRSGAPLSLGRPLRDLQPDRGGWVANGEIRARLVVGAGGHFCPVARALGVRPAGEPAVCAQEVEFAMTSDQRRTCGIEPTVPELFFCSDLEGYGWAFRKGDHLNVGLGRRDPHDLAAHVEVFRDWLVGRGKIPADAPRKYRGHAYLLYPTAPRPLVDHAALLLGDAAGLAYPESGEGIRPAIESALIAAEVIAAAEGDYRRERLAPYAQALHGRFGQRMAGPAAADRLPAGLKRFAARRLLASRWFVRRVVLERWFLRDLPCLGSAPPAALPRTA